jgi:hypothetical protein
MPLNYHEFWCCWDCQPLTIISHNSVKRTAQRASCWFSHVTKRISICVKRWRKHRRNISLFMCLLNWKSLRYHWDERQKFPTWKMLVVRNNLGVWRDNRYFLCESGSMDSFFHDRKTSTIDRAHKWNWLFAIYLIRLSPTHITLLSAHILVVTVIFKHNPYQV